MPFDAEHILEVDPDAGTWRNVGPTLGAGGDKYHTSVLANTGKICQCCVLRTPSVVTAITCGRLVSVPDTIGAPLSLYTDGLPFNAEHILEVDPDAGTWRNVGPTLGAGGDKYYASVLADNGNVCQCSCTAARTPLVRPPQ